MALTITVFLIFTLGCGVIVRKVCIVARTWHIGKLVIFWLVSVSLTLGPAYILSQIYDEPNPWYEHIGMGFLSGAVVIFALTPWILTWSWFDEREKKR